MLRYIEIWLSTMHQEKNDAVKQSMGRRAANTYLLTGI